jgi:type I site-specific deoxyribonuclease
MKETRFKDTEIGRIPEEWEIYLLGDKSEIYRGGSPRPIEEYLTELPSGINWIKIGDVKPGDKYIRTTAEKIKPTGITRSRSVAPGDLILSNSMSFGRPYILAIDGCIHDGWLVIKKYQSAYDKNYLYYVLGSSMIVGQYKSMAAGSSVQNLNKDKVAGLKVMTPASIEEQSRIAAALTSVDDLISALDKLIEKKKNIKQGSMQLLLTGKKRLKGFTDPWVEKKMGTIEIQNGAMLNSTEYKAGNIPVIAGGKQPAGYHSSSNRLANTITISASGANAGYISFYKGPIFASDCSTINEQKGISIEFLYYCLLLRQNAIYKCQTGGAQPHIHAKDIKDIGFAMPSDISEQKRIASIIESMDEEISSLETKKAKYEQIKQGMMQQLLTGKIRLIEGPA